MSASPLVEPKRERVRSGRAGRAGRTDRRLADVTPTRTSAARTLTAAEAAGDWDLVVIGAGSAGLVASRSGAQLGARTLLIEASRLGGDCLYTGCVPSKALIAAAHAAHAARTAGRFGISTGDVTVDFAHVMRHVHDAITTIEPADSADALTALGVNVLHGRARFTGQRELEVDGSRIGFRDAVIATGSHPVVTDVEGADRIDILTNDTFWDLDEQPERLLVHGGGAIGSEIAQAMTRLGTRVTLVHRGDRLLPKEDAAASAVVLAAFAADGVDVRLGTTIASLRPVGAEPRSAAGVATLSDGEEVPFDRMLAALGRRVDTAGLGLGAAGVAVDASGAVAVDAAMRTTNPHIRAAGDVTPLPRFTHTAGTYASVAALNAVLGLARRADTDVVPRVTFTSPEVGAVGLSPDEGRASGFEVIVQPHDAVDRAIADGETSGHTALVIDRRGRIRGASVVGPRAGEVLGELTTAIKAALPVTKLATTIHAYPTYADAAWNAEVKVAQQGLRTGLVGRGIRLLRGIRRRRD